MTWLHRRRGSLRRERLLYDHRPVQGYYHQRQDHSLLNVFIPGVDSSTSLLTRRIGGENIYPLEIEERLVAHPAVGLAVVGLKDSHYGEVVEVLFLWHWMVGGRSPQPEDLRRVGQNRS